MRGLGAKRFGLLTALLVVPIVKSSFATLAFLVVFRVLIKLFFSIDIILLTSRWIFLPPTFSE